MLDTGLHQATGLHSLTPQADLRVLAMAGQGQDAFSLEVLCQICASLQRLGYPVVVLDGTAQETTASPGLIHLLHQAPWGELGELRADHTASSLAVIPASQGLDQLRRVAKRDQTPPLQVLQPYFRAYSILVLHAPAPLLGPLLTHTHTTPLVVMGTGAAGVMSTYQHLKQIALHAGLPCMVASLLQDDGAQERRRARTALHTLQSCAKRHLGELIRTTTIASNTPQELQRLALQLLENAGTMGSPMNTLPTSNLTGLPAHIVRSH